MAKYTVSLSLDCRVDVEVEVEADSFEEAFRKADKAGYDWNKVEVIGSSLVNAMDEKGVQKDYNG